MLYKSNEIVKKFRSFYQQLYQVGKATSNGATRKALIQDYLTQAKLQKLPATALEVLEGKLTIAEFRVALKSMAKVKHQALMA